MRRSFRISFEVNSGKGHKMYNLAKKVDAFILFDYTVTFLGIKAGGNQGDKGRH